MNPPCARCGKTVYPTEKISCLDKNWHKGCFHCEVCKMTLNMKNYKGYDKKPYCNAFLPCSLAQMQSFGVPQSSSLFLRIERHDSHKSLSQDVVHHRDGHAGEPTSEAAK
ncbi:LIM zinc-binding domain-containing Nebulette-like isoform X2 [Puntigrus tetrazona]|uniref:LIM zinc-binding domain-containing Nebulette-like isoform X2 n=1 Tax=Puntigrus tetrazona TaxID=1606681 RepID=UPI001C891D58|nr:LIM zinc-binding domain-containing Nebulette-like isoform X2 [Puntigrus tetrazona]